MAAVTHRAASTDTANATSYTSGAFTPGANELLVVFVAASGTTVTTPTLTDSQGLGFTRIQAAGRATNASYLYCFVANALAAASSMTVTFDCTGDTATGASITVAGVSGMSKTGATAVRQSAKSENNGGGTTPAPAFASSALTANPTLGGVGNASNPAGLTPPTNWTERADVGYTTPDAGLEYVSRDSGFTGTTITWGSTSTVHADVIVELDSSASGISVNLLAATEADTAQPLSFSKPIRKTLTPATTTNTAQALVAVKPIRKSLTAATEVDAGQPLGVTKPIRKTLGIALETDAAQILSITHPIVKTLTPATEANTATALTFTKTIYKALTAAVETATAVALVVTKPIRKTLGTSTEADTAVALTFSQGAPIQKTLTPATEVDAAQALSITIAPPAIPTGQGGGRTTGAKRVVFWPRPPTRKKRRPVVRTKELQARLRVIEDRLDLEELKELLTLQEQEARILERQAELEALRVVKWVAQFTKTQAAQREQLELEAQLAQADLEAQLTELEAELARIELDDEEALLLLLA